MKKSLLSIKNLLRRLIKPFGKDIDKLKLLIDRFIICFNHSKDSEFRIRSRPIYEFFGQKVRDGVCLICQEYDDDGKKWLWYLDPVPQSVTKTDKSNKFVNYDQRQYDFKKLEKKALELRLQQNQGG